MGLCPGLEGPIREACGVGALAGGGRRAEPRSPGLILRRCELDEEGIAHWEPPTYIRCVSIDYRNIQMMVSLALESPARPGLAVGCFSPGPSGTRWT